jgi:hypothetical protein
LAQVFSSAPCSQTSSPLCSSLNIRGQVPYPYKASGKFRFCMF